MNETGGLGMMLKMRDLNRISGKDDKIIGTLADFTEKRKLSPAASNLPGMHVRQSSLHSIDKANLST